MINNDLEILDENLENEVKEFKKPKKKEKDWIKKIKNKEWFVDINKVRTNYVRIKNLKSFLGEDPPILHPDSPEYAIFWLKEAKKCIEGLWKKQFEGYRYMPGSLYFFGKYTIIEDDDEGVTVTKRPKIVDYFWDFAYDAEIARGFSGFSKDERYTSHLSLKDYLDNKVDYEDIHKSCFNSNGQLKEYVHPSDYLFKEHPSKLGKPLYYNESCNTISFGTRGGGKSYWGASQLEYRFVFYDAKNFKQYLDSKETGITIGLCVGSEDAGKSSEFLDKFRLSQEAKANTSIKNYVKWFGLYGSSENDDFVPNPFFQRNEGSLKPNNKQNPYRHSYKVKVGGQWIAQGSQSYVNHVNFSSKKGQGDTAASGGRYAYINYEEVGLIPRIINILGHNESTIVRKKQFGVQAMQGTSGLIEYVQGAKQVFLDPLSYNCLAFDNENGSEGVNNKVGRFIPAYMVTFQFKDKNGNTNFEKAIRYENRIRYEASLSNDPRKLRLRLMNKPCYTHEMWLTDQGYYFPYEELAERERELLSNNLYQTIGTAVKLVRQSSGQIKYEIDYEAQPVQQFPFPKDKKALDGTVMIYEFPEDNAPIDMYHVVSYDPYVEEDIDKGGSIACTYVFKNSKYIPEGYTGDIIVASYIGKPREGLDYYHENQLKLLEFYNCAPRSLWYENNRGQDCRNFYINKGRTEYLALTPQRTQGNSIYEKRVTSYGFNVGNKVAKLQMVETGSEWLKRETTFMVNGQAETKMNLYRIPCLFLIQQLMQFDMKGNFDAVSSFIGGTLGIKELESYEVENEKKTKKENTYKKLLSHSFLRKTRKSENKYKSLKDLL